MQATSYLADATRAYLRMMVEVGRDKNYTGHARKALEDFEHDAGNKPIHGFDTECLREHLFGLPYAAVTIRHRRSHLLCAFAWWIEQGWISENPVQKVKRRQVVTDEPGNLWAWLERTPESAFSLTPRQVAKRRERAYERAGLLVTKATANHKKVLPKSPPKNCLRHSFVSYHVALHRDPGKTALIVSHRSQEILWQHYLGVANREDTEQYFAIFPN